MYFGKLPADTRLTLSPEELGKLFKGLYELVRRDIENHRSGLFHKVFQAGLSPFFIRKEAFENETIIGQSTIDQGRDKGCSPRERFHRDTFGNTSSGEQKSWIGNGRGTCITDKGELLAVLELSKDSLKGLVFVELMVGVLI